MTSSSTTTTISTTTICWKSTANGFKTAGACRKKRSLVLKNTDTLEKGRRDEEISASKSLEGYGDPLLDSSIDKELNEETERNARLESCLSTVFIGCNHISQHLNIVKIFETLWPVKLLVREKLSSSRPVIGQSADTSQSQACCWIIFP